MSGIDVELIGSIDKILESNPFDEKSNYIALEVVQEIVENAMDVAMEEDILNQKELIGDIVDQYTPRCVIPEFKSQKLTSTEEEVKKLISDINVPSPKGLGDQLMESKEVLPKKKSFTLPCKQFTLERKARLTDLVKNSKSLLSKFLNNEASKQREHEWEEKSEQFLKSIELDNVAPGAFKATAERQIKSPLNAVDDAIMENVDLSEPKAASAGSSRLSASQPDLQELRDKKKKWNLGAKIVGYLKKKSAARRDAQKAEN